MDRKKEIPLSVPNLDPEIADNLRKCVESGWVSTGGPFIAEFERSVADYASVPDAVACQSGTAGLHTALRVLGVGPLDEVIVPTLTFIAAVNPVRYQFAEPVFMDCDGSFCLDPEKLELFCKQACVLEERGRRKVLVNKASGRRVAAVIVVHVFGNLADMERIMEIARRYHLCVLEDATEALGSFYASGRYKGRHAGTIGDMGVFSFNANKIITTGGGGMILAGGKNKKSLGRLEESRYLTTTARDDALRFVHGDAGYNYRMLNIQAAIGVSQIRQIEHFVAVKKRNYDAYAERLCALGVKGVRLLPFRPGTRCNHWFYPFEIDEAVFGRSRDDLMEALIQAGIQCRPVWRLCHLQKPYSKARRFHITKAPHFEKNILNLPCSTNLTIQEIDVICAEIRKQQVTI
ncbi:MAG: DegT/DnrJ/EryC1/StrS family aminotransferase [Clostridiales Family XIII bacterium]|nr:DegT/DnrJ/EryC1/StrS family aminotransferase [Clostridiales Family XIII bacterium]